MTARLRLAAAVFVLLVPAHATAQQDHVHPQPPAPAPTPSAQAPAPDHSGHDDAPADPSLPPFIPPVSDADRAAAFPTVQGHAAHDNRINYFVLFDKLEWQSGDGASALHWDNAGWIGRDLDRLWFRTEGDRDEGGVGQAEAQVFYGRAISRWWDLVGGVRQEFSPGPARTWAAIGLQGLAPYWFDVQATASVGGSGRTHVRFETVYELLLTNRLILQPLIELDVYGKSDEARGIGAGLSSVDAGVRLRYEFRREFAPYIGVTWDRMFFGTADLAREAGQATGGARLAVGLRVWM